MYQVRQRIPAFCFSASYFRFFLAGLDDAGSPALSSSIQSFKGGQASSLEPESAMKVNDV